jgi:putative RecB family exonuclease
LERATAELLQDAEGQALALGPAEVEDLVEDARSLVANYFVLEDPNEVRAIGTELRLQADLGSAGGHLRLRGIIDRLELDADGGLVVTDYKTGKAPGQSQEQNRLGGVHFYAFLCEQVLGRRPVRVQLFHLREPMAIYTSPSDQSITGLQRQATAIWAAVKKACVTEDFRPKPGFMCQWCGYHAYCPAQGGDPALAALAVMGIPTRGRPGTGPEAGPEGDAQPSTAPTLFPVAIG